MLVNLLAEMKRYQITEEMLGEVTGKKPRQIRERIKGNIEISSDDIKKIRNAFFSNYSLDYLLSETPILVIPAEPQISA